MKISAKVIKLIFFQSPSDQYLATNQANSLLVNKVELNCNFSVICINIRSLNNLKIFSKLESLLSSLTFSPSVIAITETWLKPNQTGPFTGLPGYIFVSNSRRQTHGGEIGFFIRENLVYTLRQDTSIMNEKVFESLFIDIKFKNKTITCGCIYRAPCNDVISNSDFLRTLESTLLKV